MSNEIKIYSEGKDGGEAIVYDESILPSEISDVNVIHCQNVSLSRDWYGDEKGGKWIFFLEPDAQALAWSKLIQRMKRGDLPFLTRAIAHTAFVDKYKSSKVRGKAVLCYCGPYDSEEFVKECGRQLVDLIEYKNSFGEVSYKSNTQSYLGSRGTGHQWNSLYSLPVPFVGGFFRGEAHHTVQDQFLCEKNAYLRNLSDERQRILDAAWDAYRTGERQEPIVGHTFIPNVHDATRIVYDSLETGKILKVFGNWQEKSERVVPSEELGEKMIYFVDDAIAKENVRDPMGEWILHVPESQLDDLWRKSKELYLRKELEGIVGLKCTTAKFALLSKNSDRSNVYQGCSVGFYCGPHDEPKRLIKCGENLVEKLEFKNSDGFVKFKTFFRDARDENVSILLTVPKVDPEVRKPTAEIPSRYRTFSKQEIVKDYPAEEEVCGYWQMVFETPAVLDQMWEKACNLYEHGELPGVRSLLRSTTANRGRFEFCSAGMIGFVCGPHDEPERVEKCGENLVAKLQYKSPDGFMKFETFFRDAPEENICIWMTVPKVDPEGRKPTAESSSPYLSFSKQEIVKDYPVEEEVCGLWQMVFETPSVLDQMWEKACGLYENGELPGVRSLVRSTSANRNRFQGQGSAGMIGFVCGPFDEQETVKKPGRMVADLMDYRTRTGFMVYKKGLGSRSPTLYKLPMPKPW